MIILVVQNMLFNVGSYWLSYLKESVDKTCNTGKTTVTIVGVKGGTEASNKQVDTLVTFLVDGQKAVCHFYNTTQLIMVNGLAYKALLHDFLVPFFEAKVDSCISEIDIFKRCNRD